MNSKCPQCGAPVDFTLSNCKYCGEKITNNQHEQHLFQQPLQQPTQQPVYQQAFPAYDSVAPGINPSWPIKNKVVAGLLAIFLGTFGIHKFYLGKIGVGFLYLIFFWTYIPGILGFIQGIIYLLSNDHNFQVKHKVRIR